VVVGLPEEMGRFARLLRLLDERECVRPSRCEGWTVGDVAAHLTGTFADVMEGRLEGQGTPEVSDRQVAERRDRTPDELADELDQLAERTTEVAAGFDDAEWARRARGGFDMTLGQAMESLWCGVFVHADDIRAAVGRPSVRGPGLRASIDFIAEALNNRGWGPATLALDGMVDITVGATGSGSDPRRITGDPLVFVLVATGRADPGLLGLDSSVNVFA
jgi:uncharacterized protein (TIGR03083 family)